MRIRVSHSGQEYKGTPRQIAKALKIDSFDQIHSVVIYKRRVSQRMVTYKGILLVYSTYKEFLEQLDSAGEIAIIEEGTK